MKHFSTLVLLSLLFFACQSPAPKIDTAITAEETQIAKDLIQGAFDHIWGGADSTKILDYHTEDFIILENGEIWDNDRIKEYMRKQLSNPDRSLRINKMDYISIEKYGPSIQIAYNNHADFMRADTLSGTGNWLESALAVPTKDGWRLKMMHSTWAGND